MKHHLVYEVPKNRTTWPDHQFYRMKQYAWMGKHKLKQDAINQVNAIRNKLKKKAILVKATKPLGRGKSKIKGIWGVYIT